MPMPDGNTAALRSYESVEAENERRIAACYDEARTTLLTRYWRDEELVREGLAEFPEWELHEYIIPLLRDGTDDAELARRLRARVKAHVEHMLTEDDIRALALDFAGGPVSYIEP